MIDCQDKKRIAIFLTTIFIKTGVKFGKKFFDETDIWLIRQVFYICRKKLGNFDFL